ncbi:MAG: hypothetical protein ACI9W2_000976 [Gammaproteobacteria bacterium]|jgi:hypothetical protein
MGCELGEERKDDVRVGENVRVDPNLDTAGNRPVIVVIEARQL